MSLPPPNAKKEIDKTKLRLSVLGILVFAMFVGLFSRLWFLQVLAKEEFRAQAKNNRVRQVYSEPPRGRILDRRGRVLVENRTTKAITITHDLRRDPERLKLVVRRLANYLDVKRRDINKALNDGTVSPYKPVPVVSDVKQEDIDYILAHRADLFPGVGVEVVPVRVYPYGSLASHVLGWVNEITPLQLKMDHFKKADVRPAYSAGDIVGQDGVELYYDRFLRGKPGIQRIVVNASGIPISQTEQQEEETGADLRLSLDIEAQRLTESTLEGGLAAARGLGYPAPAGAIVVLDPRDGGVISMASYPDYNVSRSAPDGFSTKYWRKISGTKTPKNYDDDRISNRAVQAQRSPGSTFKAITMAAAMATDVASPYTTMDCPASATYPPDAEPGAGTVFPNWASVGLGATDVPRSLRISCNTFFYELGWQMENTFDGGEDFQKYARRMGVGQDTGIDLLYEADGLIPDRKWCEGLAEAKVGCFDGWLPGYTVNMAIGQGDVLTNPLQMAVAYASIANGGYVLEPHLGKEVGYSLDRKNQKEVIKPIDPTVRAELGLDSTEIGAIQQGLNEVTSHGEGTARDAFSGFPFPIAGKTGTAELGDTGQNDSWFISYGPVGDPKYVVAVYLEKAGHGGETAAPVAREVYEGLLGRDAAIDIQFGQDSSN